jgi:NTP pyrophosphatase (non-canonical NTP hydrolase)
VSDFDTYQQEALRTAGPSIGLRDGWAMASMGLAGEAGEAVDMVKKHLFHGHPLDKAKLVKELGDVLWYLAVMSEQAGVKLSEVAAANVVKLRARYPDGFDAARSLHRKEGA